MIEQDATAFGRTVRPIAEGATNRGREGTANKIRRFEQSK